MVFCPYHLSSDYKRRSCPRRWRHSSGHCSFLCSSFLFSLKSNPLLTARAICHWVFPEILRRIVLTHIAATKLWAMGVNFNGPKGRMQDSETIRTHNLRLESPLSWQLCHCVHQWNFRFGRDLWALSTCDCSSLILLWQNIHCLPHSENDPLPTFGFL